MLPVFINGRYLTQHLSGVQRFAGEIARAMAASWATVDGPPPVLLAPTAPPPSAGGLSTGGLSVKGVGKLGGQIWEQAELPRVARSGVLINLGNTAPVFGGRQIVVLHDAAVFAQPGGYSWKFRLWYRALQACLVRSDARLVTVSEFSRSELSRFLRTPESRISVIPEGAEHILRETPDPAILDRNGLSGKPFVLAVGNLAPHKNLAGLGNLAKALAARGVPLVISGGVNSSVFSATASLPEPAKYVGRVTDGELHALYRAASCFVFPSLYEGFGLPSVEAMACGCPVVASAIPALEEISGDAALYANPAVPDEFSAQVLRILDDASLAATMKAKGLKRAQDFTWVKAAERLKQTALELRA
ncbi:glycosyltransferase family 4 protein [Acetobacter sacchari]